MNDNIVENPDWWPHRYDANRDAIQFIKVTRDEHRQAVFLTDENLPSAQHPNPVNRDVAVASARTAPLHFIFHSAYCCSTLLAKAFDIPGVSMGLKEPVILNDIAGWRARGAQPAAIDTVLDSALTLLSRPFSEGESIIVKPSNLINSFAAQIMAQRPNAKAVFLYTPLEGFLGSIARKGMMGRLWVRDLMVKQLEDGIIDLGLEGEDYLRLTDMQAAAVGWLAQHALFASLIKQVGPGRVVTLQSDHFMKSPHAVMKKLSEHFSLNIGNHDLDKIISGPVFQTHSKNEADFDSLQRESDRLDGIKLHADEIDKVTIWAKAVAQNIGLSLTLPSALVLDDL